MLKSIYNCVWKPNFSWTYIQCSDTPLNYNHRYMYMCMHVCMHVCMYACVCVHTIMCIRAYVCVSMCVYPCVYICARVLMFVHVCMWVYACACVYMHVHMYACVYIASHTFLDTVYPLFTTGLVTSFKCHHTVLEFQNELNRTTQFIICDTNDAGQWKLLLYFHLCSRKCKATYTPVCMHQLYLTLIF